jgi:methylglutaconyl-CoA hydratase
VNISSEPLLYESADGVARLTLNRPAKRNALDKRLLRAILEALKTADGDPAVRVVTLTGAGTDFCAGLDLAELERDLTESVAENLLGADLLVDVIVAIRELRKPVVALVRGRAVAGGCGLATACDLVFAAADASFGYTEIRLGFVPAIVMALLRRNITEKRAFEMAVSGELYDAVEAERLGLINRAFAEAEFEPACRAFVETLAERSPDALWLTKRHLYGLDAVPFGAAVRAGAVVNVLARNTDDTRQGVAKFLASRDGGAEGGR